MSEMRSLLGICGVHRRFLSNFARLTSPLNLKLKEGALRQFEPNYTNRDTVNVLVEKLVTLPILALQWLSGQCTANTDDWYLPTSVTFLATATGSETTETSWLQALFVTWSRGELRIPLIKSTSLWYGLYRSNVRKRKKYTSYYE